MNEAVSNQGEQGYLNLLADVMQNGNSKQDRTGTGTKSVFGRQLRFDLSDGFPLLTTKRVFFRGIAAELLWFLAGSTNIKSLVDQKVSIWSAWPHKHYVNSTGLSVDLKAFEDRIRAEPQFAEQWGELGPVYGAQWRTWKADVSEVILGEVPYVKRNYLDQVQKSIDLLKSDPNSRRNIVMAWNPADIDEMTVSGLPPCHYMFQLCARPISREDRYLCAPIDKGYIDFSKTPEYKLDMMVNMRSADCFLGVPFNIASYSLLLHMYAQVCGMIPGELVLTTADTHIYSNHFSQVGEQLLRTPRRFPRIILDQSISHIDQFKLDSFTIEGYDPYPSIAGKVAV